MENITQQAFEKFIKDDITQLAAALAFYVAFSYSPLVIIFYSLAATLSYNTVEVFGEQIKIYLGVQAQELFQTVVLYSKSNDLETNIIGRILGIISVLFSASLIFDELRLALNRIFEVKVENIQKPFQKKLKNFLKERLTAIGMVLSFNLLIIFSLLASSTILGAVNIDNKGFILLLTALTSWLFYILAFTLMLHFVPVQHQRWKASLHGGILIAFLFLVGKELIGIYIGKTAVGTAYGAAGSVIVLLVWIYYSAMVIFLGAEMTYVVNHNKK
jgi:membrane protein